MIPEGQKDSRITQLKAALAQSGPALGAWVCSCQWEVFTVEPQCSNKLNQKRVR